MQELFVHLLKDPAATGPDAEPRIRITPVNLANLTNDTRGVRVDDVVLKTEKLEGDPGALAMLSVLYNDEKASATTQLILRNIPQIAFDLGRWYERNHGQKTK